MALTLSGTGSGKINDLTVPTASGTVVGSGASYPLNIDANATNESFKIDSSGRVDISNQLYIYGDVASGSTAGVRGLTATVNQGFTFDEATDRITTPVAGTFHIHFHQLVNTPSGNSVYMHIRVNGSTIKYGYVTTNQPTIDLHIDVVYDMSANDYIDFYMANNVDTTWGGAHANFYVHKIN